MNIIEHLTREQLVKALTEYYHRSFETPDDFYYADENPEQAAKDATDYIFEIAAQQSKGE